MRILGRAAVASMLVVLAASPATAASARKGKLVMGTVLEVTVVARDDDTAARLTQESLAIAEHWDDVLTTWRPDGELARLNASAGDGAVEVSTDLARALRLMLDASVATGGAFDPAVGPIVERLRSGGAPLGPSPRYRIATALDIEGHRATLVEGAALDAGGIGKGIALDAIAGHLRERGAEAWFLDFGGSSQTAQGAPEGRSAWVVMLAGNAPGALHGTAELEDGSLSTSRARGDRDAEGAIVDPARGAAVGGPRLATVFARDATTAEAWSTALVVLGREGLDRAAGAGVEVLYEDRDGVVETTGFPR